MMVLKYAVKYFFTNNEEIKTIADKVKKENDKYLEMLITSPIPPVIEKDISFRE